MGFSGFLEYIERICPQACERVDLGQLARKRLQQSAGPGRRGRALVGQNPLFLLVDAESCLHRLYGGSFTDWVCGGEWNNMFHFVDNLARACRSNNIKLIVFFSGSLEKGRIQEWIKTQNQARNTAYQVLSHVHNKGTPPPKAWFTPPVAIDTCVRLAMRQCGITTYCSSRDHPREVITYLRQYGCHGLLAQTPEFALFDPPLLFSSHLMKLTKKGELLSVQYSMEEVAKTLNLHPERFVILAALLGNHILTEEDLALFHWSLLGPDHPLNGLRLRAQQLILPPLDVIINTVSEYVRNLQDTRNLEAVARDVFKSSTSRTEEKIRRFKACVEYYWFGTREAWTRSRGKVPKFSHYSSSGQHNNVSHKNQANTQSTQESAAPQIVVQAPEQPQSDLEKELTDDIHAQMEEDLEKHMSDMTLETIEDSLSEGEGTEGKAGSQPRPQTSTRSKTSQDPQLPAASGSLSKTPTTSSSTEAQSSDTSSTTQTSRSSIPSLMEQPILPCLLVEAPPLPFVAPEVLRIAKHRHETGTMMSQVAQALRWGEIKIGVTLEDEMSGEFPLSTHLFRPIRQKVYGILFSCQHLKEANGSGEMPKVVLKEWLIRRESTLPKPDLVEATPMDWLVPPIQRLWLGREPEDKTMRLRAFLSCMYSDSPAMLKTTYVPRHAIILCCVLRYMLHFSPPILRRHELDALLAQSVSPCLNQPPTLQELRVPSITARGVQLAAIFMRGVEAALFANDACGAPIPWELCCPWLYFDGKLFQYKLHRAMTGSNLRDLCDGKMDQVGKVERMRQCIQEGVHIDFARPVIPHMGHPHQFPPQEYYYNFRPAGAGVPPPMGPPQMGRGRGMQGKRPPVPGPGGRLEVAGVVVGEWAGSDGSRGRGGMYSGSGTAVRGGRPNQRGGMGRGTYGNGAMHGYFPAGPQQMWGVPDARQQQLYVEPGLGYRRPNQGKPKPKRTQRNNGDGSGGVAKGRGRGMTIETDEPSAGGVADPERGEEAGYPVEGRSKLSVSDSVSDTSSSEEDVPGAFSDAKETLSPGADFGPAPTDFQGASEDVVSSYHEGGYDLPGTHHPGPPYNGGVDTVHDEGRDVGDGP